jgi:hypothetical protein
VRVGLTGWLGWPGLIVTIWLWGCGVLAVVFWLWRSGCGDLCVVTRGGGDGDAPT